LLESLGRAGLIPPATLQKITADIRFMHDLTFQEFSVAAGVVAERLENFTRGRARLNASERESLLGYLVANLKPHEHAYLNSKYQLVPDEPQSSGLTGHHMFANLVRVEHARTEFVASCTGENGRYLLIRRGLEKEFDLSLMQIKAPTSQNPIPTFVTYKPKAGGQIDAVRGFMYGGDAHAYAVGLIRGTANQLRFSVLTLRRRPMRMDMEGVRSNIHPLTNKPIAYRLYCYQLRRPRKILAQNVRLDSKGARDTRSVTDLSRSCHSTIDLMRNHLGSRDEAELRSFPDGIKNVSEIIEFLSRAPARMGEEISKFSNETISGK
jgi:hypothetical protein